MKKQKMKRYFSIFTLFFMLFSIVPVNFSPQGKFSIGTPEAKATINLTTLTATQDVQSDSMNRADGIVPGLATGQILGNGPENFIGAFPNEDILYERTALKFDLSVLPRGKVITNAQLKVYVTSRMGNPTVTVSSATDDNWTESNKMFPSTSGRTAIVSNDSITSGMLNTYYQTDVTNFIASEYAGDNTVSFVLTGTENSGNNDFGIGDRSQTTSSKRPMLEITYTDLFTVTFDSQGGSPVSSIPNVISGQTITAPTPPTKVNYSFGGWYRQNTYLTPWNFDLSGVINNITLYAKWIPNPTYTVTFDSQGGSTVNSTTNINSGQTISAPTAPTWTHHTFGGWFKENSYTTPWNFGSDTVTNDTTLYAKWTSDPTYTVTFDSQGGTTVNSISNLYSGGAISQPTPPTFPHYTFIGWYKELSCTNPWNFVTDAVTNDTTLYALWAPAPTYTVTFDSQSGSSVNSINTIYSGDTITAPTPPIRSHYSFGGWYKEDNFTDLWNFSTDTVTNNKTLYAKWIPDPTYTVTFDSQSGTSVNSITSLYSGDTITTPTAPTRLHYSFGGWYKEDNFADLWDFGIDTVTHNKTLYAKWIPDPTYTVTFDSLSGSSVNNITGIYAGETILPPAPPTLLYSTFGGWYKEGTGVNPWIFGLDTVSNHTTLYAKWIPDPTYTITFDSQSGSTVNNITGVYSGQTIIVPTAPTRTHFDFGGWYTESLSINPWNFGSDTVSNDMTLYAKWTPSPTYTVTFDSQSGSPVGSVSNLYSGDSITAPTAPIKPGFFFGGWYKEDNFTSLWNFATDTVTNNRTLYAKWTLIPNYTFTYSADTGGTITGVTSQIVDTGTNGTTVTAVPSAGYHFVNWSDGVTTAVRTDLNANENITVIANFAVNAVAPSPAPNPTPAPDKSSGTVIDNTTGETVKGVPTEIKTEADGTKTVAMKAQEAIVFKEADGSRAPLADLTKLSFGDPNGKVALGSDGTIQVKGLEKGTETKVPVTYDLGNGQKITLGKIVAKVSNDGAVDVVIDLIDPYGIITDAATGKVIDDVHVVLYYANTERNKITGKTPNTLVPLPIIDGFKPNNNINPQNSDLKGSYAFMVFPTTDYYLVATKAGYDTYTSPIISVEQEIVEHNFKMNLTMEKVILNYTAGAGGSVIGDLSQTINKGGSGSAVTAVPNEGYHFVSWSDGVTTATRSDSNVNENSTVTANFAVNEVPMYTLTYIAGNGGSITGSLSQTVSGNALGSQVTAIPKAGYHFTSWSDGITTASRIDRNVTANLTVTANFAANSSSGGGSSSGGSSIPPALEIKRIAGLNRIDTALEIAKATFKDKVENIVLATAENYPDALAGSVFAYKKNAPILLVGSNASDQEKVLAYMKESMDSNGTVFILGGTGAVSSAVEQKLKDSGFQSIKRIGGADRYETAALIAENLDQAHGSTVILASGENFPDALSISSIAAVNQFPILLVKQNELPEAAMKKLKELNPNKVVIAGLEGAIGKTVEEKVSQSTGLDSTKIVRIGGSNRYETSLEIAKYFNVSSDTATIATGKNFPDALAGSIYSAKKNGALLLVEGTPSENLKAYLKEKGIQNIAIFGGESAVSKEVEEELTRQ